MTSAGELCNGWRPCWGLLGRVGCAVRIHVVPSNEHDIDPLLDGFGDAISAAS